MIDTRKDGGTKHDQKKIRVELLSARWLCGVGAVLTFGAYKYAAHNWRKGIELSRLLGAALRHIFAFLGGEDLDPETGLCHLYHASCCLMFASELWETRKDLDDRHKIGELPPFKWNEPAGRGLPHPKIPDLENPHGKLARGVQAILTNPLPYTEADIQEREKALE